MNDPDIICVSKMHLKSNQVIKINSYEFYGQNRVIKSSRATRGSGGIGIFVKIKLFDRYNIEQCFEYEDNVLGIVLKDKNDIENLVVYAVYLPPENLRYGQFNEQILNLLTCELYKYNDADTVVVCGDFNARIGDKSDNELSSDLPIRISIDKNCNSQGAKLLEFVNDSNSCIVNG